jgi:hypothetical protein
MIHSCAFRSRTGLRDGARGGVIGCEWRRGGRASGRRPIDNAGTCGQVVGVTRGHPISTRHRTGDARQVACPPGNLRAHPSIMTSSAHFDAPPSEPPEARHRALHEALRAFPASLFQFDPRMREGWYADRYFVRTTNTVAFDQRDPVVRMQVFAKQHGIIAGVYEVIRMLQTQLARHPYSGARVRHRRPDDRDAHRRRSAGAARDGAPDHRVPTSPLRTWRPTTSAYSRGDRSWRPTCDG